MSAVANASGATVVAGIGFRHACAAPEIVALVGTALSAAGLARPALGALATAAARADDRALRVAAETLSVPILPIAPDALAETDSRVPTRSPRALAAHGVGSLAEAAALAATGSTRLALARIASANATCALAFETRP